MTNYISISSTRNRKFYGIVRSNSLGNELLGKLGFIRFKVGNNQEITVLCQITSVDRRNTIHEDSSFGPVIANKGSIPYLSGIGDYEESVAKPIAQQVDGNPAALRANPPSGTSIVSLDDQSVSNSGNSQTVFNSFASAESQFLRYGGTLVGESIKVPFICKSFNPAHEKGWGEARHAGFFGRSGSGKTHAAKIMLALTLTGTSTMGAFIPDGKADFITDGKQDLDLKHFLGQNDRKVEVIKIDDLKLEDADHFRGILIKENIHRLMINGDKQKEILDAVLNGFTDGDGKLIVEGDDSLSLDKFIQRFNDMIKFSYAASDKEIQKKVDAAKEKQSASMKIITSKFDKVIKRFTHGQDINQMIDNVLQKGAIYFLDIETYEDELNRFILGVIYRRFRRRTSYFFRQKKYSNAIVYVDEANRFIPQSTNDDQIKSLAMDLIDGIKTTRQYGLAWWFADQRPAAISKDAFTQLGTYFFGEGMIAAADKDNMEAVIGKEGLQIYDYVMSTSRKLFVATGQFVGIGNNDAVTVPINFFGSWAEMAEYNNQDFNAYLKSPKISNT